MSGPGSGGKEFPPPNSLQALTETSAPCWPDVPSLECAAALVPHTTWDSPRDSPICLPSQQRFPRGCYLCVLLFSKANKVAACRPRRQHLRRSDQGDGTDRRPAGPAANPAPASEARDAPEAGLRGRLGSHSPLFPWHPFQASS